MSSPKQINPSVGATSGVPEQALANVDQVSNSGQPPERIGKLEIHPLAGLVPTGPKEELHPLADSIAKNGLLNPADTLDGKIIDGRRRAAACLIAGVELRTTPLPDGIDPVEFVIARNLHRRHLSASQRATVAAKLMPHYQVGAAERKRVLSGTRANPDGSEPEVTATLPEPAECGEAREKAAKVAGAKPRYVSDAVRLLRESPELFKEVESGAVSIPRALKKLEQQHHERDEQQEHPVRDAFLTVLWDDSDAPPTRAPEKSYGAKTYSNLAFFRFHSAGDTKIEVGSKHGLTHTALFVVPVEQGVLVKDKQGRLICKATCRFLALSVRGDVPEVSTVPNQIITDGFEGVIRMVESMFPDALKAVSTANDEVPRGWQYIPRQSSAAGTTNGPAAASDPTQHLEVGGDDLSSSPSGASQPHKPASGAVAKVEGCQPARKTPPNTVRHHLSKLSGNLYAVIVDLKVIESWPQTLRHPDRREDREHAITVLEAAMKQITRIVDLFGVPGEKSGDRSTSVGDLPFSVGIVVTGSSFTRVQRISKIVAAVAKSIQKPAPKVAAELENVAGELERVVERARSIGGL